MITALSASASHEPTANEEEGCAVTLGGWGAPAEGNNPGHILESFFDDVFPSGMNVGPNFYANASEVQEDLREAPGDVFLKQAIALKLNINFGNEGYLNGTVSGVEVDDPTNIYDGWTAEEVLAEAESFLTNPAGFTTEERTDLLEAMDAFNNERYGCNQVPPPEEEAPPCPENVMAIAQTDGDILVSWDEVNESLEYRVYRAVGEGAFTMVAQTSDLEYLDTDTTVGETYRYIVTAYDTQSELESEGCDEVQATAIPFFPGMLGAALAVLGAAGAMFVMRRR